MKLPPDYAVAVKAFNPKDAVVLRVAYPPGRTVGKGDLPPEYEVAVRGPFIPAEDPRAAKAGAHSSDRSSASDRAHPLTLATSARRLAG